MSMKSSSIIGGAGIEKRRELDFYPTPKECTIALMDFLNLSPMRIWEPACGTGEMSVVLERYGHTVYSSDLRHTGYGVGGQEYLTTPRSGSEFDAVITNPPFNQSEEFIKRALLDAPIVAMLLKSQYWHAKKRYHLFRTNKPTYVLPLLWRPDFTKDGAGSPTMDLIWTVWIPGTAETIYQPLEKPYLMIDELAKKINSQIGLL